MGGSASKHAESGVSEKDVRNLKQKVRFLQEDLKGMMREKEKESRTYESDMMLYAFKEAEWKQEKKKLKEEVKMLKMMVEDKQEKIREKEEAGLLGVKSEKEWESLGIKLLMEHMKEERTQRDAAVRKWKQLYLEIKAELDELIQRTYYQGEEVCWRAEEENEMEKLKEEVADKKETIKALEAQLASMEHEKYSKERELDLLKQSLRIMSSKKKSLNVKGKLLQSLHL